MAEHLTSSGGTRNWPINIPFLMFFSTVAERKLNPHLLVEDHTIQYKFYCQLPMGAFQRQVLIVQVIKKTKTKQKQEKIKKKKKRQVSQIDYQ